MKHKKEPWDIQNKGNLHGPSARVEIVAGSNIDGSVNLPKIVKMPNLSELSYANAERIVACVNACEGINPEAVPKLLKALKKYLRLDNDRHAGIEIGPQDWGECHQLATVAIGLARPV